MNSKISDKRVNERLIVIEKVDDPKIKILHYVDLALDLANAVPSSPGDFTLNVAPPDLTLDTGVDPASIKDPKVRDQYQKSILKNRQNIKIAAEVTRLKRHSLSVLAEAKKVTLQEVKNHEKKLFLSIISKIEVRLKN